MNSGHNFAKLVLFSLCVFSLAACDRTDPSATANPMSQTLQPPSDVTPAEFRKWRNARRGNRYAEVMTNPYWSWLVNSDTSSWAANGHFGGPSSYDTVPAWSAQRFGQSTTLLPDGRTLLIAGEHEDSYDPDFFIYNDIIIRHSDGRIEILGFPESVFPPTDFHSATWVDDRIILIGNLGYPSQRVPGKTQILQIDPATWEIRRLKSSGESPGWIHRHEAVLEEGSILVRRGMIWKSKENGLLENFDDWRLHLADWRWERLTHRPVTVYEFHRKDGEMTDLFEMRMWVIHQKHGPLPAPDFPGLDDPELLAEMQKQSLGKAPKDSEALDRLFDPDGLEYQELSVPDDSLERHIRVGDVLVRYDESINGVRLVIEGELPEDIVTRLRDDLRSKLERAEGVPYKVRRVGRDSR